MAIDTERVAWVRQALKDSHLDALVVSLPANVLMMTGYWPVTGTSVAVATREQVAVLVPDEEEDLAAGSSSVPVRTFAPGSLREMRDTTASLREPFRALLRDLGVANGSVGFEKGSTWQPATYSAIHLYQSDLEGLLCDALPGAHLVPADDLLARLRSVKTPTEIGRIRESCDVAGRAFTHAREQVEVGMLEMTAAALVQAMLSVEAARLPAVQRAGGFAWCMSGPNAALAYRSYARSTPRSIEAGEFVLIHVNSYVNGYWTDLTRTYTTGEPDERQMRMIEAVFEARSAAIQAIQPGVRAADVDAAAREVLEERGFGHDFLHSTGHGVGIQAIDHNALPRLHPASPDVIEAGMTFNIEPAIYREGYGGIRHCDMVCVTSTGAEVLSDFQTAMDALEIAGEALRPQGPMKGAVPQ